MWDDLDEAHTDGRALSCAFGCLIAAVRLRGTAMFSRRVGEQRCSFCSRCSLAPARTCLVYYAVAGECPFHSAIGYTITLVPVVVIGTWGVGPPTASSSMPPDSTITATRRARSWSARRVDTHDACRSRFGQTPWQHCRPRRSCSFCSAVIRALSTLTVASLLCMNFRRLSPRISRVLLFERRFVHFWGADRKRCSPRRRRRTENTFPRA